MEALTKALANPQTRPFPLWVTAVNAALVLLCVGRLLTIWKPSMHTSMGVFDDAFMFTRYADHVRAGLGLSWNPDGVHTYGETSLLWGAILLPLTALPLSAAHQLLLGSWSFAVLAMLAIAWAIAMNARGRYMRGVLRVLPLAATPLVLRAQFLDNVGNGMETMLAMCLVALYTGMALLWTARRLGAWPLLVTGALLFLTRPEAECVVLLLPCLLVGLKVQVATPARTPSELMLLLAGSLTAVGIVLLGAKLYFGTALPLSFYMKSGHAYEGYHTSWQPFSAMLMAFAMVLGYLALPALLARGDDWRLFAALMIPTLVVYGYLLRVTQIMGVPARYYCPYLATAVIASLLVLDRQLAAGFRLRWTPIEATLSLFALLLLFLIQYAYRHNGRPLIRTIDQALEQRPFQYDAVSFDIAAKQALPKLPGEEVNAMLAATFMQHLPPGTSFAATEVGVIGEAAPMVRIIDMAGLNDSEFALQGFSAAALMARKPDVIYFPHTAYTWQRGVLFSSPELLRDYDVYEGAALFGMALRRETPVRAAITQGFNAMWQQLYPGYAAEDYRVRSLHWSGRRYRVGNEADATQAQEDVLIHAAQK